MKDYEYLLSSLDKIKGIGKKTANLFFKKNIYTVFDLLWHLPLSKIETSEETNIKELQIGKMQTIRITPLKYNFPRIRNLPNKVFCEDEKGKIDIVFFNSREGYIRKILPLNSLVIISGKVNYFKKGELVDVIGKTIGKGYAGVIKRHNFSMQDATHGNSLSHRALGSTGQCQTPGRVFKGKKMAGQMGNVYVTEECLEVLRVDNERNLLLVKGAVPGSKNGFVKVFLSDKKNTVNEQVSKQLSELKAAELIETEAVESEVVETETEEVQSEETEEK